MLKKFEGLFVNPFSDEFLVSWDLWKEYKLTEFKFSYKSEMSQQAAINELVDLSGGDEEIAKKIIKQSMAMGWKGLFELKKDKKVQYGQKSTAGGNSVAATRQSVNDELDKRFGVRG